MRKIIFIFIFIFLFVSIVQADTIQVLHGGVQAISTTGVYMHILGSASNSGTETIRQIFTSPGGIITNLRALVSVDPDNGAGTQSVSIGLRVNEATLSPNVSCTITEGTTSCTSSNVVSVTASQRIDVVQTSANTPAASNVEYSFEFIATADNATWIGSSSSGTNLSQSETQYFGLINGNAFKTVENLASFPIPTSGTLSNLTVRILSAPANGAGTQSYTMTVYKNGSSTGITCVSSESTSNCADAVNTTSVTAGDVISIETVPANTPAATCKLRVGLTFTPNIEGEFAMFSCGGSTDAVNTTYRGIYQGNNIESTTESAVNQLSNAMVVKGLYAKVTAAPGVGASWTNTVRDDATATTLTCVISGDTATTCNFTDTGNYVAVNSQMSVESIPAGSPAASTNSYGILGFITPPRRILIN